MRTGKRHDCGYALFYDKTIESAAIWHEQRIEASYLQLSQCSLNALIFIVHIIFLELYQNHNNKIYQFRYIKCKL